MDSAVTSVLQNQGWAENKSYATADPADVLDGYQKDGALCLIAIHFCARRCQTMPEG